MMVAAKFQQTNTTVLECHGLAVLSCVAFAMVVLRVRNSLCYSNLNIASFGCQLKMHVF